MCLSVSLADLHSPTGLWAQRSCRRWQSCAGFFHTPSLTSTYDTSESIATRNPESSLDDDQIREPCWLHHCTYKREKQVLTDHEFFHPLRENSVSSSSHFRENTGKPVARVRATPLRCFSNKKMSSQEAPPEREDFPHNIKKFQETTNNSFCDFSEDNLIPIVRKSNVPLKAMKNLEDSKQDFMKNWLRRTRMLRDTRIRNILEVKELEESSGRANWRVLHEWRESHQYRGSLHKYRVGKNEIFLNDARESQDVRSILQLKIYHTFPVNGQLFLVLVDCWAATPSLRPDTWNLLGDTGKTSLGNRRAVIDSSQTPYQGILHSWKQSAASGHLMAR